MRLGLRERRDGAVVHGLRAIEIGLRRGPAGEQALRARELGVGAILGDARRVGGGPCLADLLRARARARPGAVQRGGGRLLVRARAGLGDAGVGVGRGRARLRRGEGRVRLREPRARRVCVELDEQVARAHVLVVGEEDARDDARRARRHRHEVAVDLRVVRRLDVAPHPPRGPARDGRDDEHASDDGP